MEKTKIKTLIKQIRGVSYKPENLHDELDEGSVILLRANNIDDGKINFDDVVYVDKSKVSDEQYLKKGDILICASSGSKNLVGKAASVEFDRECTFGAFCKVVRPNSGVEGYLGVFFQSPIYRRKISEVSIGANINNIRNENIDELDIPMYSADEQTHIVKMIQLIQDIIVKRKVEMSFLDNLIKARFVELFGNTKNKVLVGEMCNVTGGYSFKSDDISNDGAIKILQIGNVYLDNVNWETVNYLPKGYDEKYSRFLLNEGDIVVALTRPIIQSLGNVKACIVKSSDLPCLLNQRVGRIVPKEDKSVLLEFIYGCLMTDDFTRYVESCSIGCSQPNISTKDIENYLIPNATYEEQTKYVEFKRQTDKSKVAVQKALDETQLLFDSLMQQYFG